MAFKGSDVEVPATMVVDGQTYKDVGIQLPRDVVVHDGARRPEALDRPRRFRGLHRQAGHLGGYRIAQSAQLARGPVLPALGALSDRRRATTCRRRRPTTCASSSTARAGACIANVEQFNKDFIKEWFKTERAARDGRCPGSPGARGGLEYLGDDVAAYKRISRSKRRTIPKAWADLINLTQGAEPDTAGSPRGGARADPRR